MVGHLWQLGVAIDPGRLIDDGDTAYYLPVISAYREMLHRMEDAEAAQASRKGA
jgi:hypothetical protein